MQHTTFTLKHRYLAWLYGLWLNGITYVFYSTEGSASIELEAALLFGSIPAIVQILVLGLDTHGSQPAIRFSCVFVLIILLSYLGSIESWKNFAFLLNIIFVFIVAMIIAACPDRRMITSIAASYAVMGAIFLLFVNLTGDFQWGRLIAGSIHPNFWGLIAVSVGAAAFALRSRTLWGFCWIIVLVTLFNTSSRGSMVALTACLTVIVGHWLVRTYHLERSWALLGAGVAILALVMILDPLPQWTAFVWQDVLKVDDPYRGLGTGLTGRTAVWAETLEIWMEAPLFGVGFRQHESMITTASSAHNAYLTMLADTGVFGLVAYLALIGFSLFAALWRIDEPRTQRVVLAMIVSYAVLGFFERRALNSGNPFSIWFIIACFYAIKSNVSKFRSALLRPLSDRDS